MYDILIWPYFGPLQNDISQNKNCVVSRAIAAAAASTLEAITY